MAVKEILDTLFEFYGGVSEGGIRSHAFGMVPRDVGIPHLKIALAFSYEAKNTPDGEFFIDTGTAVTIIFNKKTGRSGVFPQHSFPMKSYSREEIDALLSEVGAGMEELTQ